MSPDRNSMKSGSVIPDASQMTRTSQYISRRRSTIAETGIIPAGYQLIRDTYPFEVIDKKEIVVEDVGGRELPVMRVAGLIQMGDCENANGRIYPTKEVLAPAVRNIQEDISKRAVMGEFDHPCFTSMSGLAVLTINGWRDFKDIRVGDHVWSRVGGRMIRSRVNSVVNEPYNGQAYRIRGKDIDIGLTPGHRCLLLKRPDDDAETYATIQDIYVNRGSYRHSPIPKTARWSGNVPALFELDGGGLVLDAAKLAGLLGLYLANGHIDRSGNIVITQNGRGRRAIRNLLSSLHPDLTWNECGREFHIDNSHLTHFFRQLGDEHTAFGRYRHIPRQIMDLDGPYLEELIRWFIAGSDCQPLRRHESRRDGVIGGRHTGTIRSRIGSAVIRSTSKKLIDDLHECLIKTGRCGHKSVTVVEDDYGDDHPSVRWTPETEPIYQLHVSNTKNIYLDRRHVTIEPFHHIGNIYCLSVDHGNFYIEYNGCTYWTGNSDAKIHLDRVSHLMTKVWMDGRKIYGEAEVLHKLPCGACLRGLFEHKVRVGISSRGVGDMELVEHNGREVYRVLPGYAFVTWDAVAEPSVDGAILNIQESLARRLRPIRERKHLFSPQVYQDLLVKEINDFFDLDRRKTFTMRDTSRRR